MLALPLSLERPVKMWSLGFCLEQMLEQHNPLIVSAECMCSDLSVVTFSYTTAGCLLFKMYTVCLFSKHRVEDMHVDQLMLLYT